MYDLRKDSRDAVVDNHVLAWRDRFLGSLRGDAVLNL